MSFLTLGSYHFWKWADNDLPGKPAQVFAALMAGQMPAELSTFDATVVLQRLEQAAAEGAVRDEEWGWEAVPAGSAHATRYVSFTGPEICRGSESCERFARRFGWLGLSGFHEESGQIIPTLRPKRNVFIDGQRPAERFYDIEAADLPWLIKRLDFHAPNPFGILENAHCHFTQCCADGRRYYVEWAENRICEDRPVVWDQWRAQDAERLAAAGDHHQNEKLPKSRSPDLLRYCDTLAIMTAFLKGERRPARYPWRNIEHLVSGKAKKKA